MAGHDHDHGHHHHHHHGDDVALPVREEPMDPAQQSLSDALRVSFTALKFVMVVLVVLFLVNGFVFNVDEKEVVVVLRFGEPLPGEPKGSGLHFSLPYPIDERITVPMYQRALTIDDFWLRISERDRAKDLSDLPSRSGGLNPQEEGALLTGDRALMHLLFTAQYRVRDDANSPKSYVRNVPVDEETLQRDPAKLLAPILRSAAVSEAARTPADVVWRNPQRLVAQIRQRAQEELDALKTGIELTNITADSSYFPLQVKSEFLGVSMAANRRRQLVQEARQAQAETLLGAAGPVWETVAGELERLDQAEDKSERDAIIARISELLEKEATGEAGRIIQEAKSEREEIVEEMLARVRRFERLLEQFRENPELVKTTLQKDMLQTLWDEPGVDTWLLPEGESLPVLWLNKDQLELRKAERELMEKRAGQPR